MDGSIDRAGHKLDQLIGNVLESLPVGHAGCIDARCDSDVSGPCRTGNQRLSRGFHLCPQYGRLLPDHPGKSLDCPNERGLGCQVD